MLDRIITARLKNIVKAYEIALDIAIRVRDTVTHTCLSGKVYHHINLVFRKNFLDEGFVGNATMDERPILGQAFYILQSFVFEIDIVVIGNGVYTNHLDILKISQQTLNQISSDEAGSSRYQDGFTVQIYIIL